MARLTHYRTLLTQILTRHATLMNSDSGQDVQTFTLFDNTHNQYMVFRSGWHNKERVNRAVIYARLQDGKIWIEEDWTESGIATELVAAGVPREAIVLGFRHPDIRPLTEFAVA